MIFFVLFFSFSVGHIVNNHRTIQASYTPAAPLGPTYGFQNVSYTYSIMTSNPNATWMFDWGDGNRSEWLQVGDSEHTIVQTHKWNTPGAYRVRAKYRSPTVGETWSSVLLVTITTPDATDFPNTPEPPQGKTDQTVNRSSSYTVVSTDENGDMLQYRMNWGNAVISDWSSFADSGTPLMISYIWTQPGVYNIKVQARDVWGLHSPWSNHFNVTVWSDADSDGLSDRREQYLGSNYLDASDVHTITIHSLEYFVVFTKSGTVLFYNDDTETNTIMQRHSEGIYVIDVEGDGTANYLYYPASQVVAPFEYVPEPFTFPEIPWLYVAIIVIILVIAIILLFLYKKGFIYVYEEYIVEE